MQADNEYIPVLTHLYEKSLILHDTSLFDKTLYFYFVDAIAHIDYTCGIYAFNYQSPKNVMGAEYMRWRIDEEKKGDRIHFPAFIAWLKTTHPEKFAQLPSLWQMIYDPEDPAGYRSFRIVTDPDSRQPIPANFFFAVIDEFFEQDFLKSLYEGASLARLFGEFLALQKA
ncbi:MAG: hypothetical protein LUQ31_09995 [Methanoregula sp.]|nr:hypothetical protein [Methanoregula sp.]